MWPMNKLLQAGELVAALAVVISVIILTVEIRQNSEAQIRSTTQAAVSDYIQSLERFVDNPDFACLYIRGVQDYRALNGAERVRFSAYYMSTYYQLQEMLRLADEGSIDADTWSGFLGLMTETTRYPGVRQWFGDRRAWFSSRFQDTIDALIEANPPTEQYIFRDIGGSGCATSPGA
jgi:hypothetical protein